MKLAEDIPFYADLIAPPHGVLINDGACGTPGEVAIDDSWNIRPESDDAPVLAAAEDMRDFLKGAMGVKVNVAGTDSPAKCIALRIDKTLGDGEAHSIKAGPDSIAITGGNARGVLHGVFRLQDLMRRRRGPYLKDDFEETRNPLFTSRIHRSCVSPFYAEETTGYKEYPYGPPEEDKIAQGCLYEDASVDAFYHDRILLELARHGFNGIWLRGCLCIMSRVDVFPEFGADADTILERLGKLGKRAEKFGIDLFLYLQEPLGLMPDDPFWKAHPDCRGAHDNFSNAYALCTSVPKVKSFLKEGTRYIFEHLPALKGLILITASEFQTHCYSRVNTVEVDAGIEMYTNKDNLCSRCAERLPQEVVSEIITLISAGAREVNPDAEIIAWNWGWQMYEKDPQAGVLERLSSDIRLIGGYEIGETTRALDVEYVNEEYSLRIVGPSARFKGMTDFHKARGGQIYAKLQLGTTHENPTVPYLPLMDKVARKYQTLRETGVTGLMTCWNFGNIPSRVTELAGIFSWDPQPTDIEEALKSLAERDFGEAAENVVKAWRKFSRAWEDFPGVIPVMYFGPLGRGPAWHFHLEKINRKMTYSWMILNEINGDSLDWTEPFDADFIIRCFDAQLACWRQGEELLDSAPAPKAQDQAHNLALERGLMRTIDCQLTTTLNVAHFLVARNRFYDESDAGAKAGLLDEMAAILVTERANCMECLPLVDADPRLGFHAEAYGYMFNRPLIEEKLRALDETLNVKIPALQAHGA